MIKLYSEELRGLWRHVDSGKLYVVVCESNRETTRDDFQHTVSYRDSDGVIWSRRYVDFLKRMEKIS